MRQQSDNNDRKLLKGTSGARNSGVPAISVLKPGKHVLVPITQSFHRTQYVVHCSCSSTSRSEGLSNLHKPGRNQQASPHPPWRAECSDLEKLLFDIILFFLHTSNFFTCKERFQVWHPCRGIHNQLANQSPLIMFTFLENVKMTKHYFACVWSPESEGAPRRRWAAWKFQTLKFSFLRHLLCNWKDWEACHNCVRMVFEIVA